MLLIAALVGCQTAATLDGVVVDRWGNAVEGAMVVMVGNTSERPLSDADGRYSLKRAPGKHQFKAGREGFIQQHLDFSVTDDRNQRGPTFELYPKPAEPGFYVVGTTRYHKVAPERVRGVGNQLKTFYGIQSSGEAVAEGTQLEVVFHNDLKLDEIMRLGLKLHKLEYVTESALPGPLGSETMSTVNLYISSETVDFDLSPMRSRTDYLITTKESLQPGSYAFVTQELFHPRDQESFMKIPDSLRVAFPITLR